MLVCPGGCMLRFCFCFRAGCSMWCHGWLPCLVLSSAAGSLTTCCPKVSIINTVLCKSLTIENKITQLLIPGNFFCISSLLSICCNADVITCISLFYNFLLIVSSGWSVTFVRKFMEVKILLLLDCE